VLKFSLHLACVKVLTVASKLPHKKNLKPAQAKYGINTAIFKHKTKGTITPLIFLAHI